jgi:hypothetical protein
MYVQRQLAATFAPLSLPAFDRSNLSPIGVNGIDACSMQRTNIAQCEETSVEDEELRAPMHNMIVMMSDGAGIEKEGSN